MIKMLMVTAILHHDIMVQHILDAKFQIIFSFYYCFNLIILLVLFFFVLFFFCNSDVVLDLLKSKLVPKHCMLIDNTG